MITRARETKGTFRIGHGKRTSPPKSRFTHRGWTQGIIPLRLSQLCGVLWWCIMDDDIDRRRRLRGVFSLLNSNFF